MNSAAAIEEVPVTPATDVVRKGRAREGRSTRRTGAKPKPTALERYFLATGASGEKLTMGRETANEQEALIAAFQERATFYVVTEFRVVTQFKGANALLVKEGIARADR